MAFFISKQTPKSNTLSGIRTHYVEKSTQRSKPNARIGIRTHYLEKSIWILIKESPLTFYKENAL